VHFFYLDETGCTGANCGDPEQPIFVLGGISVKDKGWRATTAQFNAALDDLFGGNKPAGAELHACDLVNGQGVFEGFDQQVRNTLAHRYIDIIAERSHSIHFIAIDKHKMAVQVAGAPQAFFDLTVPYLLSFNYLTSYIERYTRESKRAERMAEYFVGPPGEQRRKKLWLGFSAERQQEFDARWAHMRQLAECGFIVFVSVAPMLGPVRLPSDFLDYGDRIWCICSGEEGRGARYMEPEWARALRDQCAEAGVPFFMLQMTGRTQIPADLFVRQFPPLRRVTAMP
jgi:hypothetical protein